MKGVGAVTIHKLDQVTWEDVAALDRDRTIFFLPVSPIEEHGPHLPLGTDIYAAVDMAELALNLLEEREPSLNYVLHPGLPVGCAKSMLGFPGTVSLRPETLVNLVYDVCASLARHGFKYIVIANHHLDLAHVKALLEAAQKVMKDYPVKVLEAAATIRYSGVRRRDPLLEAMGCDPGQEVHAEARETSFIKYKHPGLLRDCYRSLPPVRVDVAAWLRQGLPSVEQMGAAEGYIGTPSCATAEYGEYHLETGAADMADLALRLYNNQPVPDISPTMRNVLAHIED